MNLFGSIQRTKCLVGSALFEREVEDTCIAAFEFESKLQAVLTVTHASFESQDTLDVFGSEGSLHIAWLNRGELRIKTAAGERTEHHPPHANIHLPLIEDFTRAVIENRDPVVGGAIGREVARIEEIIYSTGV